MLPAVVVTLTVLVAALWLIWLMLTSEAWLIVTFPLVVLFAVTLVMLVSRVIPPTAFAVRSDDVILVAAPFASRIEPTAFRKTFPAPALIVPTGKLSARSRRKMLPPALVASTRA